MKRIYAVAVFVLLLLAAAVAFAFTPPITLTCTLPSEDTTNNPANLTFVRLYGAPKGSLRVKLAEGPAAGFCRFVHTPTTAGTWEYAIVAVNVKGESVPTVVDVPVELPVSVPRPVTNVRASGN